jgi:hypothetical protein
LAVRATAVGVVASVGTFGAGLIEATRRRNDVGVETSGVSVGVTWLVARVTAVGEGSRDGVGSAVSRRDAVDCERATRVGVVGCDLGVAAGDSLVGDGVMS